jgi:hypothetical protein
MNLPDSPRFNGADYVPERDDARLTSQMKRVFSAIEDGQWRALHELAKITGDPEASISAQLRHLRKPRFGSYTIERSHVRHGLYLYRLKLPQKASNEAK